ncbi:hypothetical protein ABPG75_010597 [Micractinium tetrahymenae]
MLNACSACRLILARVCVCTSLTEAVPGARSCLLPSARAAVPPPPPLQAQAAILAVLIQRPSGPPLLRCALVFDVALMVADLAWRRRCQGAPDGGSHARHRELILPLLAVCDIIFSHCMIGRLVLDDFSVAPPGALGALRHVMSLVVASRILTYALLWSQWYRVFWAFPVHVAMVVNLLKTNHMTCQSAALAGGPVAVRVTRGFAQLLSLLRFSSLSPPMAEDLNPLQECSAVLAYLQLSLALAVPTLAMGRPRDQALPRTCRGAAAGGAAPRARLAPLAVLQAWRHAAGPGLAVCGGAGVGAAGCWELLRRRYRLAPRRRLRPSTQSAAAQDISTLPWLLLLCPSPASRSFRASVCCVPSTVMASRRLRHCSV